MFHGQICDLALVMYQAPFLTTEDIIKTINCQRMNRARGVCFHVLDGCVLLKFRDVNLSITSGQNTEELRGNGRTRWERRQFLILPFMQHSQPDWFVHVYV